MLHPSENQLRYQNWEMGAFFHFGIRTFYEGHEDWDGREMPAAAFNPKALDCRQWIRTVRQAGMRYAVLVCKHHDGFANWPSRYTDYSVAASPWKNGAGDVVREFTDACREYGMGVGLYYSPADAAGRRSRRSGKEYDDYFIRQITELLTGYGKIDILWFDGCGSEGHAYDWDRIVGEIRRLQPGVLIFNMGRPDFRWVGNEAGLSPAQCVNVADAAPFSMRDTREKRLPEPKWLPVECDVRMRDLHWFYSGADADTVKSVDELLGIYDYSVGRGGNLLVNFGPDRNGLLPEKDASRILEFGRELRRRFSRPLARAEDFRREGGDLVFRPGKKILLDRAVLAEDIARGERVRSFRILVKPYPYGDGVTVWEGENVGHKAICTFPTVATEEVRVRVERSEGEPAFSGISLFYTKAAEDGPASGC